MLFCIWICEIYSKLILQAPGELVKNILELGGTKFKNWKVWLRFNRNFLLIINKKVNATKTYFQDKWGSIFFSKIYHVHTRFSNFWWRTFQKKLKKDTGPASDFFKVNYYSKPIHILYEFCVVYRLFPVSNLSGKQCYIWVLLKNGFIAFYAVRV